MHRLSTGSRLIRDVQLFKCVLAQQTHSPLTAEIEELIGIQTSQMQAEARARRTTSILNVCIALFAEAVIHNGSTLTARREP